MRDRLPLPNRIQNAPVLWLGLEFFYSAFLDLNTCRPSGWNLGPIPWSAIADYANAMDVIGEQRDDLFFFVRSLDSAYLEYHEVKAKHKK